MRLATVEEMNHFLVSRVLGQSCFGIIIISTLILSFITKKQVLPIFKIW